MDRNKLCVANLKKKYDAIESKMNNIKEEAE